MQIPQILYGGTSYRQLRVATYPRRPTPEELIKSHIFSPSLTNNPFLALHMALENAVVDKSMAVILVVKNLDFIVEDSPPQYGSYEKGIYTDFSEIPPSNLEILLEGKNLDRIGEYDPDLRVRKLRGIIREARQFSRRLRIIAPQDYLPELRGKSQDVKISWF